MRINFLQFGEKGQPLVFLHGWQQNSRSFLPLVPFLYQHYRLFFLDLPGFGQSEKPPLNFSSFDYAGVITAWLKKRNLKKIVLVGHSFGGKIAAIISTENPQMVKKLILIASSGLPHRQAVSNLIKLFPKKTLEKLPSHLKTIFASRDYKEAGELLPVFKRVVKEDLRPIFAKIEVQTLIIWGKSDQELPAMDGEIIHGLIKKSKLVFVEGDHFSFWQEPKKIAELIKNFIEK